MEQQQPLSLPHGGPCEQHESSGEPQQCLAKDGMPQHSKAPHMAGILASAAVSVLAAKLASIVS